METVDSFFDILEPKTPEATVLAFDEHHNTWYLHADVSGAMAQADHIKADRDIYLVRPRVCVVIGRSSRWNDFQKGYFRRIAATYHDIELLTFDHIVQRAQQLIDRYEDK